MRINTPCRSSRCVHSQCFDATSWFSVMEQTTTWLCPVCERVLDSKDLIIDGYAYPLANASLVFWSLLRYFDEILKHSPESVEDVIVEADGEWHTSDNKYGSPTWNSTHPTTTAVRPVLSRKPSSHAQTFSNSPPKPATSDLNGKTRPHNQEIFILDSDDEDEGQVKRELSPSFGSASSGHQSFDSSATSVPQSQSQPDDVIDLTLDSDDEAPVDSRQAGKRKATEAELTSTSPTEQIWKKSRPDPDRTFSARGSTTTDYPTLHPPPPRPVAPGSPLQYAAPYQGTGLSSTFSSYTVRGTGSTPMPPLPSLLPRTNGHWSWLLQYFCIVILHYTLIPCWPLWTLNGVYICQLATRTHFRSFCGSRACMQPGDRTGNRLSL
jgi:E3 SUMO-protein ligase PIAS1